MTIVPGIDVGSFGVGTVHATRQAGGSINVGAQAQGSASLGLPGGSAALYLLVGLVIGFAVLHIAWRRWL